MRKAFDIEDINLDDLITTAMDDPKAVAGEVKAFKGINFDDLHIAYRQFCKNEKVDNSPVDLGEVIAFYNKALADLPDRRQAEKPESCRRIAGPRRQGRALTPRSSIPITGAYGCRSPTFPTTCRRRSSPPRTSDSISTRASTSAASSALSSPTWREPGRPQGGSTITQQVAKNLLVGDDVTYERKMREMIVASRLESMLSKAEILELYLNSIYLGRGSWGIEMAARSYFGKSAKELTLAEGAMLAGLTKGPNFYNPDRHPDRAKERLAYVLGRMQADGVDHPRADEAGADGRCRRWSPTSVRGAIRVLLSRSDRARGKDARASRG